METISIVKGWLYDIAKLYRRSSQEDLSWKSTKPRVKTIYPEGMSKERRLSYNELWKHLHNQLNHNG